MNGGTLGELLAGAGAVVGGGAALGATLGFIAGCPAQDLGAEIDPDFWARMGGMFGGIMGIVAFLEAA
jgi:hypothetical protein